MQIPQLFQPIGLRGLDQATQSRACVNTSRRAGEKPVFPTKRKKTDGVLKKIAVRMQGAVFYISFDPFPLFQGVGNGATEQAFRWRGPFSLQKQGLDGVHELASHVLQTAHMNDALLLPKGVIPRISVGLQH